MLLSTRWLNSIFPSGLSVDRIVEILTLAGLEVESVNDLGLASGNIVTAKVLEVAHHPDADRLHLVKADIGADRPAEIVCGATNLRVGMLVPCAKPGAELPGGVKIKKSKIRGATSEGMLCSAKELGFGSDHAGILELPETYSIGEPVDCILEIKVTPNRADCLSVMGIAREVAAMVGRQIPVSTARFPETLVQTSELIDLTIAERIACPRYTCRFLKDIKVGESPLWLRRMLEASGQRPINNVVDATNYVMLELGHPLHAFDYDRIRGGKIIVRFAREGERLITLDDRDIALHLEDLVIADAERPIALAGVMGGKNAEVTESTRQIAVECAYFDPPTIRRAARRHGFSTEASYRFERGTDRQRLPVFLNRVTQLIHELAHGEITQGFLDVHPPPADDDASISLDVARLNRYLGINLTSSDVADKLAHLGFEIRTSEGNALSVVKPSYRVDITREVDLIEEVARVHGYDNIPETMPAIVPSAVPLDGGLNGRLRAIRSQLASMGLHETIHYTAISERLVTLAEVDPESQPHLANPLTLDQAILRPALLPALLETAGANQRRGEAHVALFEIGKVFKSGARAGHIEDERLSLAVVLAGETPANWSARTREYDFFDLRGLLESFGETLGLGPLRLDSVPAGSIHHPGRSGEVNWGNENFGAMGELHPKLAATMDLRGRVYVCEVDLGRALEAAARRGDRFASLPKFPASRRDLAVVVAEEIKAEQALQVARKAGAPLLEEITLVDLYRGEHVPAGKKSLAMSFALRSPEGTLTEEAISQATGKILAALAEKCGASLRA